MRSSETGRRINLSTLVADWTGGNDSTGDRGGTEVHIPNPRGQGERSNNLHAYWDDLLGTDQNPAAIEKLAEELVKEYPQPGFVNELAKTNIRDWGEESVQISLKTVYNNLGPEITNFVDVPVGYDADARRATRRRVALAGYRLADELKKLFGN